ncbi:hypothetical protein [Leptolyngbya phage Lbo-JY46]
MGLNKPVDFTTAKLLKEKNYEDEDCENIYLGDFDEEFPPEKIEVSTRNLRQRNLGEFDCLAPTIAEVVDWLYAKHGIWIEVTTNNNPQVRKEFVSFDARVIHRDRNIKFRVLMNTQINKYTEPFNSPTEAYSEAILYTLTKLI